MGSLDYKAYYDYCYNYTATIIIALGSNAISKGSLRIEIYKRQLTVTDYIQLNF